VPGSRKRAFSHGNIDEELVPAHRHKHIRMLAKGDCKYCKGERYSDPKRTALGDVSPNLQRSTVRKSSIIGCKECNVHLCKEGSCFDRYHGSI
jgi:hypothetical protein